VPVLCGQTCIATTRDAKLGTNPSPNNRGCDRPRIQRYIAHGRYNSGALHRMQQSLTPDHRPMILRLAKFALDTLQQRSDPPRHPKPRAAPAMLHRPARAMGQHHRAEGHPIGIASHHANRKGKVSAERHQLPASLDRQDHVSSPCAGPQKAPPDRSIDHRKDQH